MASKFARRIPFKVSAKAARLIGRENVANADGAIVELVKNTYDADASHCFIVFAPRYPTLPTTIDASEMDWLGLYVESLKELYLPAEDVFVLRDDLSDDVTERVESDLSVVSDLWIIDNGSGMSAKIIEDHWMVIGTDFKEENIFSDKGRVRTGAKGIGRFALDRLGSHCLIHSTTTPPPPSDEISEEKEEQDELHSSKSIVWEVDWNSFDGRGKVLDEVEAVLSPTDEDTSNAVRASVAFPLIQKEFDKIPIAQTATGTAICISALRDAWTPGEVHKLYSTLASLVPPADQRPLHIFIYDAATPDLHGEVRSDAPTDFDYKLVAKIEDGGVVHFTIERNELDIAGLPAQLFELEDMKEERYQLKAFQDRRITYSRTFSELWPGIDKASLDSLKSVGPFEFTLQFYKRSLAGSKDDQRKYPYRSFNVANRRRWLDEQGGVKIYRDDFLVRPYGEARGKAHDWLGLGARVASNPLQASRKGWRVSPQQLAGTVKISRAWNPELTDQSNREGIIENETFRRFQDIIKRAIREFEDDRSHIHFNLNDLDRRLHPKPQLEGAAAAERVESNPETVKPSDAVALAAAFRAHTTEIDELKADQSQLRGLATLGTVLVAFSHEMRQFQIQLGGRAKLLEKLLRKIAPADALAALPPEVNPINVVRDWGESDQKLQQWLRFALTSVKPGRRARKDIDLKEYLTNLEATWKPFLEPREFDLTWSVTTAGPVVLRALEIDLDSIFSNLVLNSVEAVITRNHPGDRRIYIDVNSENLEWVHINYWDTGPGLDLSLQSERQIFMFGETTKSSLDDEDAGTGIGMWILDQIVNEYGGTVQAFRPSADWGFRLVMRFPVSPGEKQ